MIPSTCPTTHHCPKCNTPYTHDMAPGYSRCMFPARRDCDTCNPPVWTIERGWADQPVS